MFSTPARYPPVMSSPLDNLITFPMKRSNSQSPPLSQYSSFDRQQPLRPSHTPRAMSNFYHPFPNNDDPEDLDYDLGGANEAHAPVSEHISGAFWEQAASSTANSYQYQPQIPRERQDVEGSRSFPSILASDFDTDPLWPMPAASTSAHLPASHSYPPPRPSAYPSDEYGRYSYTTPYTEDALLSQTQQRPMIHHAQTYPSATLPPFSTHSPPGATASTKRSPIPLPASSASPYAPHPSPGPSAITSTAGPSAAGPSIIHTSTSLPGGVGSGLSTNAPGHGHKEQLQFFKDVVANFRAPTSIASGPFVPQTMYKPHTSSDRRRYVEEVSMDDPIFFWVDQPSECGILLSDAMHTRVKRLVNRDETVFEGRGPSVSIRIEWPGYRPWSRQIPTKDFRSPPGPITRAKLAKNVAKCVQRFIQERQQVPMEDDADARWRVGNSQGSIRADDLVLVSLHHVSMGSWQPHLRLRRPLPGAPPAG
ncbi:hypothetical protein CYLTODRAFT_420910 [Cylindrobasidium torrendii FP15055 ss-10]|uniref:Uncharacterized protein n=1 Tax=Cylindrobasidium torrendii FP15055 ss-10 TaxID=1314674 RepID=A0A0D7BHV0_9AGAR|nr:hypothetical protein CYLTODRAFT_420910 [Cylindrobasidium torrendii FP15055 ss-10]